MATFWGWKAMGGKLAIRAKIHNWPGHLTWVMIPKSRTCWPWSVNPLIFQNRQQVPALHPCPHVQFLQINASKWILCHLCFLSFLGALWRHLVLGDELFNFFDVREDLTWAQAQWVDADDDLMRLTPSILPHTNKCDACQLIGLRKNLQETIDFPVKYGAFL